MIKDKNGNEVTINDILKDLVGTDDLDQTKAVVDFSVYPVEEGKTIANPTYYLVAANAIVTQVAVMESFTMVEVDFRNVGVKLLQQVVNAVNQFHADANSSDVIMISTITSLNSDATHIMSLVDPLICVRGFSEDGQGSTLLQLVYATENVGFSVSNINYDEIDADLDRELVDLESATISETIESAGEDVEEEESEMQKIFKPDFIPDFEETEEKETIEESGSVRVTGYNRRNVPVEKTETRVKDVREVKDSK